INAFVPSNNNGGLQEPQDLVFGPDTNLYVASFFHNPPPGTPVVNSFVERYSGVNGMPMDQFTGSSSDGFFGLAFPTLATVPEAGTLAIGAAISLALAFHFANRQRNRKAA